MSIQEEQKFTKVNVDCNDLQFDIHISNRGQKPSFINMILYFIRTGWIGVVIIIFVTTGTLNTLYYKMQNESLAKGIGTGPPKLYAHPWSQSFQMFLGMMVCCLIPHWVKEGIIDRVFRVVKKKRQERNPEPVEKEEDEKKPPINQLLFLLPSLCDVVASTILSVALILTYASIYQMLQSITVVFTFLLSIFVLKWNFWKFPHKWLGVSLVLLGSVLVGLNTVIYPQGHGHATARSPFVGALLVIFACFIYAMFYIFEEMFLTGYDTDPLQVPGYEGFWGYCVVLFILFALYWIPSSDFGSLESFPAALVQTISNWELLIWCVLLTCNIGFYNLMGNVITLNISCATRSVLDQIRSMTIWIIQIIRGRQEFTWLQCVGFAVLFIGVWIYNEFAFEVICPWYSRWAKKIDERDEEKKRLKKEMQKRKISKKNYEIVEDDSAEEGPIQPSGVEPSKEEGN